MRLTRNVGTEGRVQMARNARQRATYPGTDGVGERRGGGTLYPADEARRIDLVAVHQAATPICHRRSTRHISRSGRTSVRGYLYQSPPPTATPADVNPHASLGPELTVHWEVRD